MPSRYEGSTDEVRALSAYINLLRAAGSVALRACRHLSGSGLTSSQFAVLEALLHCGPLLQKELCGKLLTSSGNVTFVIDALEERALVRRRRESSDRRCVRVELTDAGRELIEAVFPAHAAAVESVMAALDPAEQEQLRALCRKLGRGEGCDGGGADGGAGVSGVDDVGCSVTEDEPTAVRVED